MNKCKMRKIIRAHGFTPYEGERPDLPPGTRVAVLFRGEVHRIEQLDADTLDYAAPFNEWGWKMEDGIESSGDVVGYKIKVTM